ncbi:MAG: ribose-5-phosphate isomerase RpiA [Alphaproteobacteria bacterium]|nr:ribose-5-phosphate isomerase RpiA [Alphaproteobacteria bacterium]
MSEQAQFKRAAAAAALDFVRPGMRLGLGTGSTAEAFLELLSVRIADGLDVVSAATSERTASRARSLGIQVVELDDLAPLDLTIDGADEADSALNLIKGGGGALLREKIVAASSRQMIVIADASKLVDCLGAFALPVEVVSFGARTTLDRLERALTTLGYKDVAVTPRSGADGLFRTDSGNLVFDCALKLIHDAPALARALSQVPGVVDHGLFIGLASHLIVAGSAGIKILERATA